MGNDKPNSVRSVSRALAILEVLARKRGSQSLADIAALMRIPKTTVFRILRTLQREGYVQQDPATRQFKLGPKVLGLATAYLGGLDLREVARPALTDLRQRSEETVHLGLLDEGEVLYVEKVDSPQTIRMSSRIGARAPAHCTALGKAMLAHLPPEQVDQIIERHGLPSYTRATLTDPLALKAELASVRARGVAFDRQEHEEDVCCVAAPVYEAQGRVVAALSVSGPAFRLTPERMEEVAGWVLDASRQVSQQLGFTEANAPPEGKASDEAPRTETPSAHVRVSE